MVCVNLLNQIYWVAGATIGGLLGNSLQINTKGLDFALVALFTAIFVSQWQSTENHTPAVLGIVIPLVCLVLIGPQSFIPPAMLLLLLVGPGLEEKYGSRNLLATIAVTAFATGLVQFLLFPHSALLGASGVVFMMIVLSSFTEMKKGGIPLTMLLVVALYLGSEIADGLTRTDNVSHLTHIVGGVCGIFFGFRLARAKKR